MESSGKHLWVGIRGNRTARVYKYLNGDGVDARVGQGNNLLYHFHKGEPSGDGDCVHFVPPGMKYLSKSMNDQRCTSVDLWKVDFHGLCEIRKKVFL